MTESTRMQISRGIARTGFLESLKAARGLCREAPVWPGLLRGGHGPVAAFLPSTGREMSALLRIFEIAKMLRTSGWRTHVLPHTLDLTQRRRLMSRIAPDIVVMQGARHPLNRPSLYPGHRILFDMDDADFHLPHLEDPVRTAMTHVDAVIAGSRYVANWCEAHGAPAHVVWTGAPVSRRPRRPQADRPPVVAWAQSAPVDYHRERAFVLDVMSRVVARHPEATLRLYGRRPDDDASILAPFRAAGIAVEWRSAMTYGAFLKSLDDVAVGLSPICTDTPFSRGKSFGKVLAYLDRGIPSVVSNAADHGLFFTRDTGVIADAPEVWATRIVGLLDDAGARQRMADTAFTAFRARLSVDATALRVDRVMRAEIENSSRRRLAGHAPLAA